MCWMLDPKFNTPINKKKNVYSKQKYDNKKQIKYNENKHFFAPSTKYINVCIKYALRRSRLDVSDILCDLRKGKGKMRIRMRD